MTKKSVKRQPKPNPPPGFGGTRAYARHRKELGLEGASHVGVQKAVTDGRIDPPDPKTGWFKFEDADKQWSARTVGSSGKRPEPEDYRPVYDPTTGEVDTSGLPRAQQVLLLQRVHDLEAKRFRLGVEQGKYILATKVERDCNDWAAAVANALQNEVQPTVDAAEEQDSIAHKVQIWRGMIKAVMATAQLRLK